VTNCISTLNQVRIYS